MVKELNYELQEEDFRSWFHWNVVHNSKKSRKYLGYGLSFAVAAVLLIQGYMKTGPDLQKLLPTILLALAVIFVMGYTSSDRAIERALWKRSGLQRMKIRNAFPKVHLTADDRRLTISTLAQPSIGQEATQLVVSYSQLVGIEAIDRLLLVKQPKQIQFIARSVFESQEEEEEFIRFIESRIEDAKAHPDQYAEEPETEEIEKEAEIRAERDENAAAIASNPASHDADSTVDASDLHRVDTTGMGTIGKIAHMVAADVDEAETAAETENN